MNRTWQRGVLAGLALMLALTVAGTWWLLERGTRGAEIANVLTLPVAMAGLVLAVLGMLAPATTDEPAGTQTPRDQQRWALARRYLTVRRGIGLVLALTILATAPLWWPPVAARSDVLLTGCGHPAELRVLASPEQLDAARALAQQYRLAARRYGCPQVHPYVFALPARQARDAIAAGWPQEALRDAGPLPDVWFADSAWEVHRARTAPGSAAAGAIVSDDPVGWSPIVLGLPPGAGNGNGDGVSGLTWPDLFAGPELPFDVVRPDPAVSPTGQLATAVLYGEKVPEPARARSIEQRLELALDGGRYPLGGSLDVLCRHRLAGPGTTAVIVSEQELARFNHGEPLGAGCRAQQAPRESDEVVRAVYPPGTRSLELHLVRFGWSGPAQTAAAVGFGEWLTGQDGAKALLDVGLRPRSEPRVNGLLTNRYGVQLDRGVTREQPPPAVIDDTLAAQHAAQRPSTVLLVLDRSGSMAASAGTDTRFEAASGAVSGAFEHLGRRDEFGLWVFPAEDGPIGKLVSIHSSEEPVDQRRSAGRAALNAVRPTGTSTPLHQAIVDGVAEVGPSDDERTRAVVVVTDGEDTVGEPTGERVVDEVTGRGVRVYIVAIGQASCDLPGLRDVAAATGGQCRNTDPHSIEAALTDIFTGLWNES